MFVGLVVLHELGHFLVARRNGIEVEEFGIGFPPRAKMLGKKNGTVYTLNWLPLGGFVKLKGEYDEAKEKGAFGASSTWVKTKVLLAGVGMNLLTAFVLFTALALIGMPKLLGDQFTVANDAHVVQVPKNEGIVEVTEVKDGSPAADVGIKQGDRVVSVAGEPIDTPQKLSTETAAHAGQEVEIVLQRDGEERVVRTRLNQAEEAREEGYLGVANQSLQEGVRVERYTWSAPVVAAGTMWQFTDLTLSGLGNALSGLLRGDVQSASQQVGGPVILGALLIEVSRTSFAMVILLIALISLTLAIINAMPIPAIDGGRLFVMLLYRGLDRIASLFQKSVVLTRSVEEKIHGTGFVALLLLSVLIIISDIGKL